MKMHSDDYRVERNTEDQIINGDALEVLKNLPTHSVDSIVTDPP